MKKSLSWFMIFIIIVTLTPSVIFAKNSKSGSSDSINFAEKWASARNMGDWYEANITESNVNDYKITVNWTNDGKGSKEVWYSLDGENVYYHQPFETGQNKKLIDEIVISKSEFNDNGYNKLYILIREGNGNGAFKRNSNGYDLNIDNSDDNSDPANISIQVTDETGAIEPKFDTSGNENEEIVQKIQPPHLLQGDAVAGISIQGNTLETKEYKFVEVNNVDAEPQMPTGGWIDLGAANVIKIENNTFEAYPDLLKNKPGYLSVKHYNYSRNNSTRAETFGDPTSDGIIHQQAKADPLNNYNHNDGTRLFFDDSLIENTGGANKAMKMWGYLSPTETGTYKLGALSDDGAYGYIMINGEKLEFVNDWRIAPPQDRSNNSEFSLESGKVYPIYMEWYEGQPVKKAFIPRYKLNNGSWTNIPSTWFYPSSDNTPGEIDVAYFETSTLDNTVQFPEETGIYYIAVNTVNKKGNNQTERKVLYGPFVYDKSPKIKNVAFTSDNSINSNLAKPYDTVTLVFDFDGQVTAPTVTIGGKTVNAVENNGTWTASRNMNPSDTEGIISFSINYEDQHGNQGEEVTNITENISIRFDKTPPEPPVITQSSQASGENIIAYISSIGSTNIEYRLNDSSNWIDYNGSISVPLYTTIYARGIDEVGNKSNTTSYTTYNPSATAITSITRSLPQEVAQGQEYSMTYRFNGDKINYSEDRPVEIALILNTSGTMSSHIPELKSAAKSFVNGLPKDKNIKVGVVRYYEFAEIVSDLVDISNSKELASLESSINGINSKNGTNLGDALRYGYQILNNGSDADKHFVIMSDGYANIGTVVKDGKFNEGWEYATYNTNLGSSYNGQLRNYNGFKKIGLGSEYNGTDTNNDNLLDRFNIGHKYVTTIANEIKNSGLDINSHIVHFKRVDGAGDDAGARSNNNQVATTLGVTKEVKPEQKFYVAENAEELEMAFNAVASVIEDSLAFNSTIYEETFPIGVELIEYPNGLTWDESSNKLTGSLNNIKMQKTTKGLYQVDGSFDIKVKFNELGEKIFNNALVKYIPPFELQEEIKDIDNITTNVIDDSQLAVQEVSIESTNQNNSSFAKVGESINITINTNKDINTPVVRILGKTATSIVRTNDNNKEWKAYYTLQDTDQEGVVTFDIDLNDKYLDDSINVTSTTDGSEVVFDKTAPTGSFVYDIEQPTNTNVVAELIVNDNSPVEITSDNGADTYEFTENGEHTFWFKDSAGNIGSATAKVDWIDRDGPDATITYSIPSGTITNQNVEATISFNEEGVNITNNASSNTYTFSSNEEFIFEFEDQAGNSGSAKAKVDWIDKEPPTATINYSTEIPTNEDVIVTLIPSEDVTITNNNGSSIYTFTENGSFEFIFKDLAGNTGTATATVNNIEKTVIDPAFVSEEGNEGDIEDSMFNIGYLNAKYKFNLNNAVNEVTFKLKIDSDDITDFSNINFISDKGTLTDGNDINGPVSITEDEDSNYLIINYSGSLEPGVYYIEFPIDVKISDIKDKSFKLIIEQFDYNNLNRFINFTDPKQLNINIVELPLLL